MYTELLTDIQHLTPQNKPGINNVRVLPKELVTYIRPLQDILNSTDPEAYPLADIAPGWPFPTIPWITYTGDLINISKDFACQFTLVESEKSTVNLKTYQYKLLFDLPNDDYTTRGAIIQAFSRREWIVIVTENSGAVRLLGSMDRGADFTSQLATGSAIKGPANKYTCY